jgi:HEAT repeat protein
MRRLIAIAESRSLRLLLGVCAVVLTMSACEQPNWKSAKYINKKLLKGSMTDRQIALKKLDDIPEKKQAKAVPGLVETYMKGGPNQQRAMSYLVDLQSEGAKKAYLKEVKEQNTDYAGQAAGALGAIEARDTLPDLLELYQSTSDSETKLSIIRGIAQMPDPKMVEALTETLYSNVDNNPIALHSYSCEILGKIAQKNPGALDDKAKRALVRGQFLANAKGQNLSKPCGLAVQKLGQPAIPLLIEAFELKNKEIAQWFRTYNTPPSYPYPQNRAKITAARRLTTLRADEATDLFLSEMDEEKKAPERLPGKHAVSWRKKEGQALHEILYGLGEIGASKAREPLEEVLLGEYQEKWTNITDWSITLQLRQDAAYGLVRLGDREATDALMEMARDGVIVDLERRASMLEKRGKPMKTTKRYQFNWMTAKAFAFLATGEGKSELKSLIDDTEEKALRKKYESFMPALKLAETCGAKESAKAKAKCYGKKLTVDDSVVRKKAAWELGRLPKKAAAPVLVEHLADAPLDTREIMTLALYRLPYEPAIKAIDTVLDEESDETGQAYSRDHHRLKLLRAWLKNEFS